MHLIRTACFASLLAASCSSETIEPVNSAAKSAAAIPASFEGRPVTLELDRAQFVSPDFGQWQWAGGELVLVGGPETLDQSCYFSGRVVGLDGAGETAIAARSCSAGFEDLEGIARVGERAYSIRWAAGVAQLELVEGMTGACGVEGRAPNLVPTTTTPAIDDSGTRTVRQALHGPRFIEVALFEDSGMAAVRASGTPTPDPVLVVQAAALLYDRTSFDDRVLPLLTAIIDTGSSDPWGSAPASGGAVLVEPYLDLFNEWLDVSTSLPNFDQATLLSGWQMQGATVGLATVSGACDRALAGSLVQGVGSLASVSQTLAHEIGHTIGMWHDGETNNCSDADFVMTPIYDPDGPFPTEFSSCSVRYANGFLGADDSLCISTAAGAAAPAAFCGDGKVDAGETCDCGPAGCAGRDTCCNGATCQLQAGASCSANDECCDTSTCSPYTAAAQILCRAAQSDCDVPETCGGAVRCPADEVIPTGVACTDSSGWDGACMAGACVTRGGICEELSDSYVFDNPPYAPMCGVGVECGPMECLSGGSCVYTVDDAPDGTPCGNARQCFNGACVASSTLPGADGCTTPDLDTDGDGTRDCDDRCPTNPMAVEEPCVTEPGDPMDPVTGTGTTGPTNNDATNPSGADEDDIIVITPEAEDGCSTANGSPLAAPSLVLAVFFAAPRRRRTRRYSRSSTQ